VLTRFVALLLTAGLLVVAPSGTAHAVEPIAGPQSSGDTQFPNVGNGGYDVSHYDLDIVWEPETIPVVAPQTIEATATITAATTGAPLSSFSLDFEGLDIDSVEVNDETASYVRDIDENDTKYKLVITPASPVDGVFTTVIEYSGTPVAHEDADGSMEGWNATSDGATFLNQPVGSMTGFPNNNTPADKATYDFSLDIPSTINLGAAAAVANGELVSNVANAGRTTWVWEQQEQMASELVIISIGRYDMTVDDVVLNSGRTIPEWTFIDPTASGASGAASARENLNDYIDFFEARYGPYPGNSTGIVVDNTTLNPGINYALETQDRSFFPNSVGTTTLIHEVMHQWFGNNVSPRVWNDLWLGEGPATYAEVQLPNEAGTETAFYGQWNGTADNSSTWTTPAVDPDDDDSSDLYGSHVYDRGAMALEALRTAIGATTFAALMKEWQVRYAGQSPGTAAFIALAEELSGRDLDAFFQDWIYDADKPAWPGRFDLSLATTPVTGPVKAGDLVTYQVSVTNTGKVPLAGAVVTVALSDVVDDATTGALPAGTSLAGGTLTWTVPSTAVGATAAVSLPVTVSPGGNNFLRASTRASTLGSTCTACASVLALRLLPVSPAPRPKIHGKAQVGKKLKVVTGTWQPGAVLTYQWFAGGKAIRGATGAKLKLRGKYAGQRIRVNVTGTRPGYLPVTKKSKRTDAVV
jgi:uncharacterized repeat protein (TIGR01451 family)